MTRDEIAELLPAVGDGEGLARGETFFREELQLATRNRGMPLEALRYPITPTGLHYLLVHYDIPDVDGAAWRLRVGGAVARPLGLDLEELERRPARTLAVTLECAGNGRALFAPRRVSQPWHHEAIGTAEWTGTPLRRLLEEAGLAGDAVEIVFTGRDRGIEGGEVQSYQRSLPVAEAMREEVLLAWAMNGRALEPQHGYPRRLVVPGWYGMASVKWLDRIEVVTEPFGGYQMTKAYRYQGSAEDPGEPVSRIRARALMIPPGIPDFLTRVRLVEPGPVTLEGRAWVGRSTVERVEVSADGGELWSPAELGEPVSPFAWEGWRFEWQARPGRHTLCVRATAQGDDRRKDGAPDWNLGGYGGREPQRVEVLVAS
ncbi:MAG TPA: sulfite oxidase [Thermoanaerobaculia bacterium]|nr:sulfite oxidase [Thermoanaerobaculia bacterium]